MSRTDDSGLIVDDHAISYHPNLFRRDTGGGADLLWLKSGSGYIDISTATAHSLEHNSWWDYEFLPNDGKLRRKEGFYRLKFSNGTNLFETVVEIPEYYIG